MKTIFFTFLALLLKLSMFAQTYELGLTLGGTNYVGDVGNTSFIRPTNGGFGVIGKWNRSKRHSFRASLLYLPISGEDREAQDERRQQRRFSFENSIKELSVGIEYTFWEWDLHSGEKQMTPYLYTGISVFNYGALALTEADPLAPPATVREIKAFDNPWSVAIPMSIGIKTTLSRHLVFGFELGARYTFTDNLDGSSPEKLGITQGALDERFFGNENTNDWYFFNAITLTYTFGRKPCYCLF